MGQATTILGIETSCDETAAAVVRRHGNGRTCIGVGKNIGGIPVHFGQDGALYVAEGGYKQGLSGVRKITAQGEVSTISGRVTEGHEDGSIDGALFRNPVGVATDALGHIYVADTGNYKIRKISPSGETITLAGSSFGYEDGEANEAKFSTSLGQLWVDENFNVYVADVNKVRMISQE